MATKPPEPKLSQVERKWFQRMCGPEAPRGDMPGFYPPHEVTRPRPIEEENDEDTRLAQLITLGFIQPVEHRPAWRTWREDPIILYVITDKGKVWVAQWEAWAAEQRATKAPALPAGRQRVALELAARPQGVTRGEMHEAIQKAGFSHDKMALVGLIGVMLDFVKNKCYPTHHSWISMKMEVVGDRCPSRKNTPIAVYYATVKGRTALVQSTRKVDPRWLTTNVVDLARVAWENNDETVATILLDALADAGCPDPEKFRYMVIHKVIFTKEKK